MPRFFVLGSAGWTPTLSRQTSCYMLETRRGLIFFDCGTGISRLHDPALQGILAKHQRALVLLSHWHMDHIEGLQSLPLFLAHMRVTVAGPGQAICGESATALLSRAFGAPFLAEPMSEWGARFQGGFEIMDLKPGRNTLDGERVEVLQQPHTHPSVALRVREVSYITDTVEREESAAFAAGSSLLVHDAWLDRADQDHPDRLAHCTAEGAARVAAAAKAGALLLAHLNPRYDSARLERMFLDGAAHFPATHLASDMASLPCGPAEDAVSESAATQPEQP